MRDLLVEVEGCAHPRALQGATTVLAFCASWAGAGEALRAELRGLGATLAVLTPEGGALLQADDPPQRLRPAPRLWRAFSVELPPALTLLLLDPDGRERLRRQVDLALSPEALLLDALRAAGKAVRAQPVALGRRDLLLSSLASALLVAVLDACATAPTRSGGPATATARAGSADLLEVTLDVNGEPRKLRLDPRTTLLDALRENLGLTGTKKGCDLGQCGACTVLVDGQRIDSCLALAAQHDGRKITTIEGLAEGGRLHPMQAAFLEEDALQCGYCTPGQILSAVALLQEGRASTDDEIREGMSGNLCRCGAYPNILAAIRRVIA